MSLVARAHVFAEMHHGMTGQVRDYTGEPYFNHCARVARLVQGVKHTQAMLAAALLHDVVEDTSVCLDDIYTRFGTEVGTLVEMVTSPVGPRGPNTRKLRLALAQEHLSTANNDAKTIKLADIIDNCRDLPDLDPRRARTYLSEKAQMLSVLAGGDPALWRMAHEVIVDGLDRIQLGGVPTWPALSA